MPKATHTGSDNAQRMLRVGEVVRHVIAEVLARGQINDPVLDGHVITVPEVRMSPDLRLATVYVMPLLGKDIKPVLEALERNRKIIRTEMARKVNLRFAPDVRFRVDESFEKSSRIDAILASPEVKRDLAVLGDEDDDQGDA